ncbi:MAG TPA: hypothetical protein VF454_01925 [Gemmatimonadales bacterium]
MSDPTPQAAPDTQAVRRRWFPTFQQWRLGVLMTAIVLAIMGMTQNDDRLVKGGIVVAVIGVVMRIVNRYYQRRGQR